MNIHINSGHSVHRAEGMEWLRDLFPGGKADELNFCLFSTSGVHGTYLTIEDAETILSEGKIGEDLEQEPVVTFLVVQPRLVTLWYGNITCRSTEDIKFLKRLRATSRAVVSQCGYPG